MHFERKVDDCYRISVSFTTVNITKLSDSVISTFTASLKVLIPRKAGKSSFRGIDLRAVSDFDDMNFSFQDEYRYFICQSVELLVYYSLPTSSISKFIRAHSCCRWEVSYFRFRQCIPLYIFVIPL